MSNNLRRRIRGLRNGKELTIRQLAKAVGAAEKTVSNYELGKRDPGVVFLAKLCQVTGGDLLELIKLQLEDAGLSDQAIGVADDRATYGNKPDLPALRGLLMKSKMPPEWLMFIIELAALEKVTSEGAADIAEFFNNWQPSEQWLRYMEEVK